MIMRKKKFLKTLAITLMAACLTVGLSGCSVEDKFNETTNKIVGGITDFANDLTDKIMGVLDK